MSECSIKLAQSLMNNREIVRRKRSRRQQDKSWSKFIRGYSVRAKKVISPASTASLISFWKPSLHFWGMWGTHRVHNITWRIIPSTFLLHTSQHVKLFYSWKWFLKRLTSVSISWSTCTLSSISWSILNKFARNFHNRPYYWEMITQFVFI